MCCKNRTSLCVIDSRELLPEYAQSEYDDKAVTVRTANKIGGALKLLAGTDSEICSWVESIVREVIPLHSHAGDASSTSSHGIAVRLP